MSEQEYKTMIVPCKRCGKKFKLHLPSRGRAAVLNRNRSKYGI